MKILITGSEGFIGGHLHKRLSKEHTLYEIDLKLGLDILDADLPEVDKVIHLAAQTDAFYKDTYTDAETNILGTIRLMEEYREKLVFASSGMVNYPQSPYAISKKCGELYADFFGCSVVRLTNVYGENGHSCWDAFREADVMKIYGTGDQKRTYASVESVCDLIVKAMEEGGKHILHGYERTVNELADMYPDKKREYLPARDLDIINATQKI